MVELMKNICCVADKANWLGLDDKTDAGNLSKDEDISPQTSLQGNVLTFYRARHATCKNKHHT